VALARVQGQGLASRLGPEHWTALEQEAAAAGLDLVRYHSAARVRGRCVAPDEGPRLGGLPTGGTAQLMAADVGRIGGGAGGLVTVNIDNGVGAGAAAVLIAARAGAAGSRRSRPARARRGPAARAR